FRAVMGVIIIASIGLLIWMEKTDKESIPDYTWFAALMGLLGGITSMVGNAAFAVMALYLLSMRLPKNEYIATTAWFFLVLNVFKVPFHIFSWQTITLDSFLLNLVTAPFILFGAYLGIVIVKRISEKNYRWFIIGVTFIASIFLVI
ncbi:MAG: sulfite exporter TauE/SafE family protein, partial [Gammaproteobacteria bacterium]|nr:sulfite exporter TauE/SafE family protein [Gammaproteobacteria bacterium]